MMAESTRFDNIDHLTVSLEIQPDKAFASHPKATRTMMQLSFDQNNTFEEWNMTVGAPDGLSYQINFLNPTTTPPSLW